MQYETFFAEAGVFSERRICHGSCGGDVFACLVAVCVEGTGAGGGEFVRIVEYDRVFCGSFPTSHDSSIDACVFNDAVCYVPIFCVLDTFPDVWVCDVSFFMVRSDGFVECLLCNEGCVHGYALRFVVKDKYMCAVHLGQMCGNL